MAMEGDLHLPPHLPKQLRGVKRRNHGKLCWSTSLRMTGFDGGNDTRGRGMTDEDAQILGAYSDKIARKNITVVLRE